MWLVTIMTILIGLYIFLICIFRTGWKNLQYYDPLKVLKEDIPFKVSVVVCCRNEVKTLPRLLRSLQKQTYKDFELVLVNDHSTDQTKSIMYDTQSIFHNIVYVEAKEKGKKKAIAEGIEKASGELIITTDADCIPVNTWIETIVKYQTANPSHLIIGPVKIMDKKNFFSRLQAFEFTSLTAVGGGAAGAAMPILCNAANMAFTKKAWLISKKDLKPDEPSGDDIFLLQSIKKHGGIIRFLLSKKAFVTTQPAKNLNAFIRQRRRWAGKSTAYADGHLIFTACVVFGLSFGQLSLLIGSIFNMLYLHFFVLFFILKYFFDTKFLNCVSKFYSLPFVPVYSFILSLVYPFYIVFTAVSALFFKPKKW